MPGVKDNSVISGHRDTVFSNLGKVKIGARIVITVESGRYVYQVERIRIVSSNDRTVIVPTEEATLTLSTCYPFIFVGNAPERYIVVAKLLSS
jgi:sortase A